MHKLMQRGAMKVDRARKTPGRRDPHVVCARHIEGAIAADAEIDAGILDDGLDLGGR